MPSDLARPVRRWLYLLAFLIGLMVVVGGYVRLTRSGLAIVEWNVITGVLPPIGESAWQAEFAKYQATPEYQKVNAGMTFKASAKSLSGISGRFGKPLIDITTIGALCLSRSDRSSFSMLSALRRLARSGAATMTISSASRSAFRTQGSQACGRSRIVKAAVRRTFAINVSNAKGSISRLWVAFGAERTFSQGVV